MRGSFKLFQVGQIAIRMHITFPLILIYAAIQFGVIAGAGVVGALFGLIVVSALFVIVTLHELGHSVAAMRYGVPVHEIILLPIGGVAQLTRIPEKPVQEFIVAIAGPAVNFALAIIFGLILLVPQAELIDPTSVLEEMNAITFNNVFTYIFMYNLFLGLFNLLPAFPMDGGRMLRAGLALFLPYVQATGIASFIGRTMALLFGLWGFLGGNFFLILIAFFIYIGAGSEFEQAQTRNALRGLNVAQAYSRQIETLSPNDTLQDAVNLALRSVQGSFPVVDEAGQLQGLLTYRRLIDALQQHEPEAPVQEAMERDIHSITPSDELYAAQEKMRETNQEVLPVLRGNRLVGLLTARDVAEVYRLMSAQPDLLRRSDESQQTSFA